MLYIGYDHNVGGVGDFVYILFQYYYFYRASGVVDINICIPDHPLKHCIECMDAVPPNAQIIRTIACASISNVFVKYMYNLKPGCAGCALLLYSNMNDYLHLCVRHAPPSKLAVLRREFRERVFRVSPRISNYVDALVAASPAAQGKYAAIHVRLGDKYLRGSSPVGSVDERCSPETVEHKFDRGVRFLRARLGKTVPIFIFCDNIGYKTYLAEKYQCCYFKTQVVHVAAETESAENAVFDTFAEFVLLSRAVEIFAVSISNFSQVAAFIYDVPIFTTSCETGKEGEIYRVAAL